MAAARVPANQKIWRNILIKYTSRRHDSPLATFDSRSNKTRSRDPTAFTSSNRCDLQFEIFPSKIMSACAKICALADANIRFNRHLREREDADVFTNPDVVADCQSPRK